MVRNSDHQLQEIHARIARLTRFTTRAICLMPMRQINISVAKAVIASRTGILQQSLAPSEPNHENGSHDFFAIWELPEAKTSV